MKKEYEFSKKIMGTDLLISIVCNDYNFAKKIATEILKELQKYEGIFSRFIPHSELSILNDKNNLKVSNEFIEAILEAKKMFTETDGFFNPLLQISNYGYDNSFELLDKTKDRNLKIKKNDIDFGSVTIDPKNNIVILKPNQKLDFGGLLKGFLAEKMAKKYFEKHKDITGIIINIGGDIYTMGLDKNDKFFEFSIYNPIKHKEDFIVPLFNSGLATSGTYKRKWINNGKDFNHILDISGDKNPNTENISVSIISEHGARADSYTKLFLSNNIEKALETTKERVKYVIINNRGEVTQNIN